MKFSDLLEISEYDIFVVAHLARYVGIVEGLEVTFHHRLQVTSEFFLRLYQFLNNGAKKFLNKG